jgi:hypothetical protein
LRIICFQPGENHSPDFQTSVSRIEDIRQMSQLLAGNLAFAHGDNRALKPVIYAQTVAAGYFVHARYDDEHLRNPEAGSSTESIEQVDLRQKVQIPAVYRSFICET